MRRLTALALLAPLVALVPAMPSADAQMETCRGKPATHVGSADRDETVRGTRGADVIVTHGARVWAKGGNDLICAKLSGADQGTIIAAGAGNDVVDATEDEWGAGYFLGDGSDRFVGGPLGDSVNTDTDPTAISRETDYDPDGAGEPGDRDTVALGPGGGGDVTVAKKNTRFNDLIDLGPAVGNIDIVAASYRNTSRLKGRGLLRATLPRLPFTVDDRTNNATYGKQLFRWGARFDLVFFRGGRGLHYIGTPEGDEMYLPALATARMGGGDDTLYVRGMSGTTGTLSGGPGDDVLATPPEDWEVLSTRLDLAAGTFAINQNRKRVLAFESYDLRSLGVVRMFGSAGPDRMRGGACQLTIRGGSGTDTIDVESFPAFDRECIVGGREPVASGGEGADRISAAQTFGATLYGGAGPDAITGSQGYDTISGDDGDDEIDAGNGYDSVDGGAGTDTCLNAESVLRCEG